MRVKFAIDPQMVNSAMMMADKMGNLPQSLMEGRRNAIGILGEMQYKKMYLDAKSTQGTASMYHFDFWSQEQRIEVKSQRINKWSPPDMHFPKTKEELIFDWLECFEIHESLTHGWYIGRMNRVDFESKYEIIHAGDAMPQGGSYRADGRRIWKKDLE